MTLAVGLLVLGPLAAGALAALVAALLAQRAVYRVLQRLAAPAA